MRSVYIGDLFSPFSADEFYHWAEKDIPNLFSFDIILAMIPPDDDPNIDTILNTYIPEILMANSAGTHIVWIVVPYSGIILLKKILSGNIFKLRGTDFDQPINFVDNFFAPYFETNRSYSHIFEAMKGWRSVAYSRKPTMSIAAHKKSHNKGEQFVFQCNQKDAADNSSVLQIVQAKFDREHNAKPIEEFLKQFLRPIMLLFSILLIISSARYIQRAVNFKLIGLPLYRSQININYSNIANADLLLKYNIDEVIHNEVIKINESTSAETIDRMLLLSNKYGFYTLERRILDFLISNRDIKRKYSKLIIKHLVARIFLDCYKNIIKLNYDMARFRAQQFLNYSEMLSDGRLYDEYNDYFNAARKIVEFFNNNYPYGNSSFINKYLYCNDYYKNFKEDGDLAVRTDDVEKSLKDDVDYYKTYISSKSQKPDLAIKLWENFISNNNHSEKVDEAHINIINILLENYKTAENPYMKIENNHQCITKCKEFISNYPKSYLSDDCLRYILKLSYSLNDNNTSYFAFSNLVKNYKDSDSTIRVLYRIDRWVKKRYSFMEQCSSSLSELLAKLALINENTKISDALIVSLGSKYNQTNCTIMLKTFLNLEIDAINNLTIKELSIIILNKWLDESDERVKKVVI